VGGELSLTDLSAGGEPNLYVVGEAGNGEHRIVTLARSGEALNKVCTISDKVFRSLGISEEKVHPSLAPSAGNLSKLRKLAILCLTNKSHGENIVLLKGIKNNTSITD
jgi:hypothetical protein